MEVVMFSCKGNTKYNFLNHYQLSNSKAGSCQRDIYSMALVKTNSLKETS
ncbi:hypothetical protein AKJ16_DCAP26906 [Drosera capensis]